jgi:predicted PurR-regulated permease PerM
MEAVLAELGPKYRRWVLGTLGGMCVVFTASSLGYWLIGLKLAIPLALLAGFAEIVPTVGPAIACAIATVFALAMQGGATALGVLVVYGVVQAFEAYIILPAIMRGAVNMHPAVTLFTVVLWGKIFGVPGLILAIPINVTIWTVLEHFRFRRRRDDLPPRATAEVAVESVQKEEVRQAAELRV